MPEFENHTVDLGGFRGKRQVRIFRLEDGRLSVSHFYKTGSDGVPMPKPIPEKEAEAFRAAVAKKFGIPLTKILISNISSTTQKVKPKGKGLFGGIFGDLKRSIEERRTQKAEEQREWEEWEKKHGKH